MSSFCIYSHFFSKNTCELDIVLTRTINILTTNELVKLTMLNCTTGPWTYETMVKLQIFPISTLEKGVCVDHVLPEYYV